MKLDRPKYKTYEPGQFPTRADGFDSVELKYDGWWGQLLLEGQRWELYSRTGQLKKHGTLRNKYSRTVLHGEYIYGTEWAKDHPEYYNQLAVFGATELGGIDLSDCPNCMLRSMLRELLPQLNEEAILGGLFLVGQYRIEYAPQLWELHSEFEGLVFKNLRDPWGAPFGRMKRATEMDYVCMGFEESLSGRHRGWGVASIIGGLYYDGNPWPNEACKVSGLTDEQRREFFDNPSQYAGRVFTAAGKKITKKGSLRHPNFVRWRDDKCTDECTWSKA